jgi:CheY-like chemotaxis protein
MEVPRRIVVCEADELARELISKTARSLKFGVIEAVTGRQALSALLVADAVLGFLDLNLPDLNGLEVARRIHAANLHRPPKLIAISGWLAPNDHTLYLAAGFASHLARPIDPERVVEILTSARI